MNSEINVIFFDLGHVLVDVYPERALNRIAELAKVHPDEIETLWHQRRDVFLQFEMGMISADKFSASVMNENLNVDPGLFCEIYGSIFELNKKTADIVERLSTNYRLSIISNTNQIHFDKIKNDYCTVLNLFESPIASHHVHCLKPDAEIYYHALQKQGCSAASALFIDDKYENIAAAEAIGIRGIHFTSAENLEKELKKLDVNI